jgi:hypothetical protein
MIAADNLDSNVDRYFYAFMAFLFAATAIAGFTPNSLAILAGTKDSPPLIIHIHAAAMSSWLLLLTTQATLVAANKRNLHKRLGMVSIVLAPFIVALMLAIKVPGFLADDFEMNGRHLIQFKRISLFSLFYVWAFMSRKTDSAAHKRLMFLATLIVIDAAFNRLTWLPTFGIENFIAVRHTYELLLLVPIFVYDMVKLGHIHRVNVVGTCLVVGFTIAASTIW